MYLAQSTNWGHSPDRSGIWKCWFFERGENRSTRRKTSRGKDENQQRVRESNPGHIGGRRVLPPLRHPCFPYNTGINSQKNGLSHSANYGQLITTSDRNCTQHPLYISERIVGYFKHVGTLKNTREVRKRSRHSHTLIIHGYSFREPHKQGCTIVYYNN